MIQFTANNLRQCLLHQKMSAFDMFIFWLSIENQYFSYSFQMTFTLMLLISSVLMNVVYSLPSTRPITGRRYLMVNLLIYCFEVIFYVLYWYMLFTYWKCRRIYIKIWVFIIDFITSGRYLLSSRRCILSFSNSSYKRVHIFLK